MPIQSLKKLLHSFPYFFNKDESSNFYKSQKVTNNRFQDLYNSARDTYESFGLKKKCLIYKEQSEEYFYKMHFLCNIPLLKSVKIYEEDDLIYEADFKLVDDKSYSFCFRELIHEHTFNQDENEGYFEEDIYTNEYTMEDDMQIIHYIYETSSENIIPDVKYSIKVTTFDEYVFEKGFPENDTIKEDIYDHDISLDEIGAFLNVPRKKYISTQDFENTEPPYNDRKSEDDYHYMKRLLKYSIKLHTTKLPILEIWKLYGIDATLINRDKYLLRFFDENIHPVNSITGEFDWIPEKWEHKDFFFDEGNKFGEYFFVSANTVRPVKKQGITLYLKFLNSLAEPLLDGYSVDIFLNGVLLAEDYTGTQYPISWELLNDDPGEGNLFIFHAKKRGDIFKTSKLFVRVRGCSDADFYVKNHDGEIEDGSLTNPFKTIEKAIESVNGIYDLIAVIGEIELQKVSQIEDKCTILGCGNAKIINNINSLNFFNIEKGKTVTFQDLTLITPENSVLLDNDIFVNDNCNDINETVATPSVDYGVLISDLEADTFIKNIRIENNKIIYTELDVDELETLSDTDNLIQNIHLEGNKIFFTEYSSITQGDDLKNLPYIYLDDRLELITAVENIELENNIILITEYGDELAWEPKSHLISNQ